MAGSCLNAFNNGGNAHAATDTQSSQTVAQIAAVQFINQNAQNHGACCPQGMAHGNGAAIAMGHPLGATGAMILGILIDELHRRNLRYGLATLCVGGGMGIATIVERV